MFSTPGHIATASVTRHLAAKQSHVLQKMDAKIRVAEEKREKQLFASPSSPSEARP
jgi:hypothetical protein